MATTKQFNTFEETTLSFNPFKNLGEQIEYGALANSCGFGTIRKGESSFKCILASYLEQQEEIKRLREENEALKSQRPKYTCPQDEDLTGGDANYEYYYTTNEDGEMTIWKVPRHLAEIKSSTPNNWDNAVAECFRDEKFGENWDKLTYLIVREMKLKDLVKRKWKPAAEKPKEEEE
jgi:hypothetical protein